MNIIQFDIKTMSSTQLGKLLGYEKKEVNKKITSMFPSEIAGEKISRTFRENGQVDEYYLPEVESQMFAAKWNIQHLRKVVEFFVAAPKPIETPEQLMARALISAQSVIAGKDAIIEAAQPALRLESAISNDDNTLSMTEAGKKLQVKPRMFISWLYQHKYIDGGNMPYQRWINQGLLVISTIEKNGKPRSSTRVTGKGFAYFGGKISEVKFENNQHYLFYR
jgi:phage antirepressor YoqD-like protein